MIPQLTVLTVSVQEPPFAVLLACRLVMLTALCMSNACMVCLVGCCV